MHHIIELLLKKQVVHNEPENDTQDRVKTGQDKTEQEDKDKLTVWHTLNSHNADSAKTGTVWHIGIILS